MKMLHQENVPIPAQTNVEFKKGDFHIMLIELQQDLNPGDNVTLTLYFEKAGTISLDVVVKEL